MTLIGVWPWMICRWPTLRRSFAARASGILIHEELLSKKLSKL